MDYRKVTLMVVVVFLCLPIWSQTYAQVKPVGPAMTIRSPTSGRVGPSTRATSGTGFAASLQRKWRKRPEAP